LTVSPLTAAAGEDGVVGSNSFLDAIGILGSDSGAVIGDSAHSGTPGGLFVNTDGGLALETDGPLHVDGLITSTVGKAFVHPHPTDPSLEIAYLAIEGPEANTLFRGTASLVNGEARIVPDETWRWVTAANASVTTFVTPRGPANVWVEFESRDLIVLRGTADVEVNYFVMGVRDGFIDRQVIRPNTTIIPTYRGEPYATDKSERYQQILIQNGTLNPDLTPNEATARRLGWELTDREDEARPRPVRTETPASNVTTPGDDTRGDRYRQNGAGRTRPSAGGQ